MRHRIATHRDAMVIMRLHISIMLLFFLLLQRRLVLHDPHFEGTTTFDGAGATLTFVVWNLAGVGDGAGSRALHAAAVAVGADFD